MVSVIENLIIGIGGGIFSGIIVSIVFYILNDIQHEFFKAKIMLFPLLKIIYAERTKHIGSWDYVSYAKSGFEEAKRNFSTYNEWQFKDELSKIMDKADSILKSCQYDREKWDEGTVNNCFHEAEEIINDFKKQEGNFKKLFLDRITKNEILKVMIGIMIILLIIFGVLRFV